MAMQTHRVEITNRTVIFTVSLILFLWLLFQVRSIIVLFFISFILMTALYPVVKFAARFKIPTILPLLATYILLISALSFVVASLIPEFVGQSRSLLTNLPTYMRTFERTFNLRLGADFGSSYLQQIPSNILSVAAGAFGNMINVLTVFFVSYYLTIERAGLHKLLLRLFKSGDVEKKAENLYLSVEKKVGSWVRGELLLMLVVGLLNYIALLLLGIPYALPLAVLAGIFEAVPNIGPIVAAIPAIILGFTISPVTGIGTIIAATLIQQLESVLIVPRVMESATGTKPLITILVLMVGYTLGGVAGAVLAMPTYLTGKTVYEHISNG